MSKFFSVARIEHETLCLQIINSYPELYAMQPICTLLLAQPTAAFKSGSLSPPQYVEDEKETLLQATVTWLDVPPSQGCSGGYSRPPGGGWIQKWI